MDKYTEPGAWVLVVSRRADARVNPLTAPSRCLKLLRQLRLISQLVKISTAWGRLLTSVSMGRQVRVGTFWITRGRDWRPVPIPGNVLL